MKLPRDVNGSEAVRALIRLGFEEVRQTGSHRILRQGHRTVVVPQHKTHQARHIEKPDRTGGGLA